jgi:hypothetical protein
VTASEAGADSGSTGSTRLGDDEIRAEMMSAMGTG